MEVLSEYLAMAYDPISKERIPVFDDHDTRFGSVAIVRTNWHGSFTVIAHGHQVYRAGACEAIELVPK